MRHAREDYEAIQPFPNKRPHHVRIDDKLVMNCSDSPLNLGKHMDPIIPEDEPVFLIRAQDIVGPRVVRLWAEEAAAEGADEDLIDKVYAWADEMEQYAAEHGSKTPDTPEGILK